MRSFRLGVFCAAALAFALGCEEDRINQVNGVLESERVVDFGDVQIGIQKTIVLTLSNSGGGVVDVVKVERDATISGSQYEFDVPTAGFSVRAGTTVELPLKFRPFEAMDVPAESVIVLLADGQPYEVTLRGRGVKSGLIIEPNPVNFGAVLIDSSRTIDVTVTNALSETVEIYTRTRAGGVDVEYTGGGTGRFEVQSTPSANGSLGTLDPGASMVMPVLYIPDQAIEGRDDRGRFFLSNCAFDLCEVAVQLSGRGTDSALTCAPPAVDFEAVNPGVTRTLPVVCENTASDAISIYRADIGPQSAIEFGTPGTAGVDLQPGETTAIDVTFSPTQATFAAGAPVMGELIVDASTSVGAALQPVKIQLVGRAGGPTIVVLPDALDFGVVAIGTRHTKRILVLNNGFEDLVVSDVDSDTAGTGAFTSTTTSFTLPVGGSQIIEVNYSPQIEGPENSTLTLTSNDTSNPIYVVTLTGTGIALPPCAYTISPTNINFGNVPLSETPTRGFRVENVGTDVCLLNDVDFVPPTPRDPTLNAFTLVGGPQTGIMLQPTEFRDFTVRYTPTRIGSDMSAIGMYISDPRNSNPTVPLFGTGEPLLAVTCPPIVTTQVGTPIVLNATGQVVGANITGYQWTITNSPTGGVGTPNQWTPAPATAATESFLAFIVGNYDIRVDVSDDVGRTSSCMTRVVAEGEGLTVTLGWNGTGDVDLHVHNQVTTAAWFSSPNDCYYSNTTPIWDPTFGAGLGPNPELDFDNTSANGPENIRISTPVIGQPYTIGVHNYSSAAGRTATLDIFCGGVIAPTQTFTSNPLNGTDGGNCTANDFWRVATVTFTTASTCLITPIQTYAASSAACAAF